MAASGASSSTYRASSHAAVACTPAHITSAVEKSGSTYVADLSGLGIGVLDRSVLAAFPLLRSLNLSFNRLERCEGVLDALPDLRDLRLYGNRLAVIDGLDRCKRLETLQLHSNELLEMRGLADCKLLKSLRVDHNRLSLSSFAGLLDKCLSLAELDVSDNLDVSSLCGLKLRVLTTLRASGNKIVSVQAADLVGTPALEELHLDRNGLHTAPGLASVSNLGILQLDNNLLTSLAQLPRLPLLTELYLAFNRIESLHVAFDLADRFPRLEVLDVSHNLIGGDAVAVEPSVTWKAAPAARAAAPPLLQQVAGAFAPLAACSGLVELYCAGNPVTVAVEASTPRSGAWLAAAGSSGDSPVAVGDVLIRVLKAAVPSLLVIDDVEVGEAEDTDGAAATGEDFGRGTADGASDDDDEIHYGAGGTSVAAKSEATPPPQQQLLGGIAPRKAGASAAHALPPPMLMRPASASRSVAGAGPSSSLPARAATAGGASWSLAGLSGTSRPAAPSLQQVEPHHILIPALSALAIGEPPHQRPHSARPVSAIASASASAGTAVRRLPINGAGPGDRDLGLQAMLAPEQVEAQTASARALLASARADLRARIALAAPSLAAGTAAGNAGNRPPLQSSSAAAEAPVRAPDVEVPFASICSTMSSDGCSGGAGLAVRGSTSDSVDSAATPAAAGSGRLRTLRQALSYARTSDSTDDLRGGGPGGGSAVAEETAARHRVAAAPEPAQPLPLGGYDFVVPSDSESDEDGGASALPSLPLAPPAATLQRPGTADRQRLRPASARLGSASARLGSAPGSAEGDVAALPDVVTAASARPGSARRPLTASKARFADSSVS